MRSHLSLASALVASLALAACASGNNTPNGTAGPNGAVTPNGRTGPGGRGMMMGPAFNTNVAPARAELRDADGRAVGTLTLMQQPYGLLVTGDLAGLPPGPHALHFHDTAACQPPFTSAGGHFNPSGRQHGVKNRNGFHAGDMPNFVVGPAGTAHVEVFTREVSIAPGATSLYDFDGSSIIVHSGADDYTSDPAGNSGTRIACGAVVRDASAAPTAPASGATPPSSPK